MANSGPLFSKRNPVVETPAEVERDSVTTILIGRTEFNGRTLNHRQWFLFQTAVKQAIVASGATIVFAGRGWGITSDQDENFGEESAAFVAINVPDVDDLRSKVRTIAVDYEQGSVTFAHVVMHDPVFTSIHPEFTTRVR